MQITITHPVTKAAVQIDDLIALAKGMIDPTQLTTGGDLKPQASAKLIALVKKNDFLSKINTVSMRRLTRDIDAIGVNRRQLVRVPQGSEPNENQMPDASNKGSVLMALPVQLFPTIKLDTLRENADNPELLAMVEESFATQLGNDLVDLGFNGIKDDNSNGFLTLNKGWLQIAKDSPDTKKVNIDPALSGWRTTLGAVKDAADARFKKDGVFVMNSADAEAYWRELGLHVTGSALATQAPEFRFEGHTIEPQADMPKGHVMFTPLENLAHGIHADIRRDRAYHARKRVLEYTFDFACDYEIAVKEALALGKPA